MGSTNVGCTSENGQTLRNICVSSNMSSRCADWLCKLCSLCVPTRRRHIALGKSVRRLADTNHHDTWVSKRCSSTLDGLVQTLNRAISSSTSKYIKTAKKLIWPSQVTQTMNSTTSKYLSWADEILPAGRRFQVLCAPLCHWFPELCTWSAYLIYSTPLLSRIIYSTLLHSYLG